MIGSSKNTRPTSEPQPSVTGREQRGKIAINLPSKAEDPEGLISAWETHFQESLGERPYLYLRSRPHFYHSNPKEI